MATSKQTRAARSPVSVALSTADRHASRPTVAVFVVAATVAWLIVSVVAGFPSRWETIFQTAVSALTLAMVFVIQHTQARHQRATQRKLDEILLAMPGADNALVTLEHASDYELHAAGHEHRSIRQAAEEGEAPSRSDGLALGGLCGLIPGVALIMRWPLHVDGQAAAQVAVAIRQRVLARSGKTPCSHRSSCALYSRVAAASEALIG